MARRLGATQEQIEALDRDDTPAFELAWRVAFDCAAQMTQNGGRIQPATYEQLRQSWSNAQIVEIISVIGVFNYFNRFANALEIPPTK